ncbi:MAG: conserved hypothetical rane protein [Acidobacteriaceae bacterium]|nr:conserved hypothetical rane protein [Acidobacteriaceae bacterium]
MSYSGQSLTIGERILYRTGLHWIVLLVPGLFGGFLILVGSGIVIGGYSDSMIVGPLFWGYGALVIALAVASRNATEMTVTNKRVILKVGLLRKKTIELFISKLESISVEQGLVGRMLDYGNIVVRGTGGTSEPFKKVRSPLEFRRQVQQQSEDLTRRPSLAY